MGSTDKSLYPSANGARNPFSAANGVNYSRYADITRVTQPQAAADIAQISTIAKTIRVFGWNSYVMDAAKGHGLEVCLGTTNGQVIDFANGKCGNYADQIKPYQDIIKLVCVGNEVFNNTGLSANQVASAIGNLHDAIQGLGMNIPVTTDVIWANAGHSGPPSWAPTAGAMTPNGRTICNKIKSLYGDNGFLLASFYPYLDVKGWLNNNGKPFADRLLPYALFQNPSLGPLDNQFDSDYSTLRYAMKKEGFAGITVLVSETGWATDGFAPYSSILNANAFFNGYNRWNTGNNLGLTTFWFEMYDEPEKPGSADEHYYGLYTSGSALKNGITLPNWR